MGFDFDKRQYVRKFLTFLILWVSILPIRPALSAQAFVGVASHWGLMKGEEQSTGYHISEPRSNEELELVLSIKTLDNYFKDTSFGYFIELGLGTYTADKSAGNYTSSQTSGEYWYLTPTLFYDFSKAEKHDWSLKAGLGLGAGYLTVDGSIAFDAPGIPTRNINGHDYNLSMGIFLAYEYKNWVVQLKEYTPSANIEGIDLILELPSIIVGYRFKL